MKPDDDRHAHELTNLSIRWFTKHRQAIVARAFPVVPVEIDRLAALRDALDELARAIGTAARGDLRRVQVAFDELTKHVERLGDRVAFARARAAAWKRAAIACWVLAALGLGVAVWWFR